MDLSETPETIHDKVGDLEKSLKDVKEESKSKSTFEHTSSLNESNAPLKKSEESPAMTEARVKSVFNQKLTIKHLITIAEEKNQVFSDFNKSIKYESVVDIYETVRYMHLSPTHVNYCQTTIIDNKLVFASIIVNQFRFFFLFKNAASQVLITTLPYSPQY